jgi:hypothetical protein
MKRFNKYRAIKTQCVAGHTHDSKKESIRCNELHELQAAGEISDLIAHPQFWFVINGKQIKHDNGRRVGVKLDFQYKDKHNRMICEDVKPQSRMAISRDWPLRKAIFKALFEDYDLYET